MADNSDLTRLYHSDTSSKYPLPNESDSQPECCTSSGLTQGHSVIEHDRLNSQHEALMAMLQNQPIHAPLNRDEVSLAIDIGCGTGAMTIELAQRFPNATIIGIDLSDVPLRTREIAANLGVATRIQWIKGNVLGLVGKHPDLVPGSFDYIYHRFLIAAMQSYFDYIRDVVYPLLKPGGWVEMHDLLGLDWYDASDHPVSTGWQWRKVMRAYGDDAGLEGQRTFGQASVYRQLLSNAGSTNKTL